MQTRRNFISFWHDLDPPRRAELQAAAQDAGLDLIEHFDLSEQDLKPPIAPEAANHQQSLLQFVIELPRQSD